MYILKAFIMENEKKELTYGEKAVRFDLNSTAGNETADTIRRKTAGVIDEIYNSLFMETPESKAEAMLAIRRFQEGCYWAVMAATQGKFSTGLYLDIVGR
jgi:5'-3' exonuclease